MTLSVRMQGKFISNLVLIIVLNLLVKPISLFWIDAGVQNRVGPEEYGVYYVLLNITVLFNILLDLGINNFTTKNIAQFPHLAPRYFGKILSFRLLAFFAYTVCTLPFILVIDVDGKGIILFGFLLFNQLLIGLIAYARSHFSGLLLFRYDALFSILDRLLLVLFCGSIFLFSNKLFQIEWFVYCLTAAYLLATVFAYGVLIKKVGFPRFGIDRIFTVSIIKRSFPYALLILLMMIYTRVDTVMIALLHDNQKYEVGIYAQGFRVLDAFYMFAMLFAGLLLPIFSKQIRNRIENYQLMLLASRILVGGSILLAWICCLHSEEILGWIYTGNVTQSIPSFQKLMLAFVSICICLLNSTILTAFGEMKTLNILAFLSILLNIALNYYLIPIKGADGAALATLISQSCIGIAYFLFALKYFGERKYAYHFVHLGVYALTLFALSEIFEHTLFSIWWTLGVGILLLLLLGMWRPKSWVVLLKKVQHVDHA